MYNRPDEESEDVYRALRRMGKDEAPKLRHDLIRRNGCQPIDGYRSDNSEDPAYNPDDQEENL